MVSDPPAGAYRAVALALGPWFARQLGAASSHVEDLRRHAEGFSWETYTLRVCFRDPATGADVSRGFAVRREPEDGLVAPYDIVGQYRLHETMLKHDGIPMPSLLALELDRSILGMPFYAMERLEGRVPVPNETRLFESAHERSAIARQFVAVLARIRCVDWRAAGLEFSSAPQSADRAPHAALEHWEDFYARSRLLEVPLLRAAILWLRANVAGSGRLALCHGDYRLGNFMIQDGRIVGIFDWELARVSDPVEDLAWCALPAFRGHSRLASGLLATGELLDRYRDATGLRPDPDALRFWTVLGQLKAAAIFLRGSRAFEERRASDIRLAALGYRSLYLLRELAAELGILPRSA
jgi:aminoglycoside phosphotransferase (APT) family kinase protein